MQFELCNEIPGKPCVRSQDILHIVLAKRDAELCQILGVAANERGLSPIETGGKHQSVETVILCIACQDIAKTVLKSNSGRFDIEVIDAGIVQ